MLGLILVLTEVVGRSLNHDITGFLGHAHFFEYGLKLYIAAPHLESAYECDEIVPVISLILDEKMLASFKCLVDLFGIADA